MSPSRHPETRRKHRLTRLGFHFLFVSGFAMLGGALRGFNLLLVLAGLLVGALIMQWRWSRRSVEAISVTRRLPTEAFAGKPFRVRYRLRNHSRLMAVWMIRVEDQIESTRGLDHAVAVCGVGVVSSGRTVAPYCDCLMERRGRYRFGPIALMTSFPFSLFSSRQIVEDQSELHVFPKLLALRARWQHRLVTRGGGVATTARRSGPVEGDFFGLREWQTGDSQKWIHWRTTARIAELAVRQFEEQRRFDACILVDAFDGGQQETGVDSPESESPLVELAISLAATFLVHLVGSPSNRIVLAVAGAEADAVIGGGSSEGKRRMLEMLADIIPASRPAVDEAARQAITIVGHAQDLIVISPRSYSEVNQADPSISNTISPWVRRGTFRWINVSDATIDRWIVRDAVSIEKVSRDDIEKVTTSDLTEVP